MQRKADRSRVVAICLPTNDIPHIQPEWWEHVVGALEFTRINIDRIIRRNQIEEKLDLLQIESFSGQDRWNDHVRVVFRWAHPRPR